MNHKTNILLIGANNVGKRTLLSHSEIDLTSTNHTCFNVWSYEYTRFFLTNKPLDTTVCAKLFEHIKKVNALQPIQSVVVVIDITTLSDSDELIASAKEAGSQLNLLLEKQKYFDLNFIITKCDRILGFREFFGNLSVEERQQVFSVSENLDFATLLKQLNAQTIARMHQESLTDKRNLIQLFPAQFEKALDLIQQFSTALSAECGLSPLSIYFTSSTQKYKPLDLLGKRSPKLPPPITDKPFFIRDMIIELCKKSLDNKIKAKRFDKKRWIVLPTGIILIVVLLFSWHRSYQHTTTIIRNIEAQLKSPPLDSHQPTWLIRLKLLSTSIDRLNDPALKYSRLIGFGQTTDLKKRMLLLYNTELQTQFLPYIEGILSGAIANNLQHDKLTLYNSLKIYLMLTEQSHYDEKTILNWFSQYWQNQYKKDPEQRTFLLQQLKNLLILKNKDWPRNQPLINQAQQVLQQLPEADIIFLELQGNYKNQYIPLSKMLQNQDNLDLSKAAIPALFNPDIFKQVFNQEIPQLVTSFSQGNWVIGQNTTPITSQDTKALYTSEVRDLYLQYLAQAWQKVIPEIQLKAPTSFADVESLINEMTNPQSGLMELLQFASGNINLNKQFKPNKNLQQVTLFLSQGPVYQQAQTLLKNLSDYLKPIVSSDDINKASYNLASAILNNSTQTNPIHALLKAKLGTPVQSWLNTIAHGSWAILLQNASVYLNTVWNTTVLPTYASNIAGKFPFNNTSDANVSLKDFSGFLGPDGTIDVFFNYYLKPFVNMDRNYWTWQTLYDQHIPIPQKVLDMFMRASLIQQMFFTDDHLNPSFKFSLIPISKSASISAITLNIEGQIQQYTSLNRASSIMIWPGPSGGQVSMNTTFASTKPLNKTFGGPWALFRFLQSGTLIPLNDPQKYVLTIPLGNDKAVYHIITDNRINPLIPDVLNRFVCPNSLTTDVD